MPAPTRHRPLHTLVTVLAVAAIALMAMVMLLLAWIDTHRGAATVLLLCGAAVWSGVSAVRQHRRP